MEDTTLKISKRTFITSILILLALMIFAGILAQILPQGSYVRNIVDGREVVVPDSYAVTKNGERLPFWKVFAAPLLVPFGSDGVTVLGIIVFLMVISGDIALLNKSGVMAYSMQQIVEKNRKRRYQMLFVTIFIFMAFGALVGVFEESATLVPFSVALAVAMGWDALVGLGMSMLAAGFGFAVAISNPFTLSIAQELAGLPAYSGFLFHVMSFLVIYVILAGFLYRYAKAIDRNQKRSLLYREVKVNMATQRNVETQSNAATQTDAEAQPNAAERHNAEAKPHTGAVLNAAEKKRMQSAMRLFLLAIALVVAVVLLGIVIPAVASNALVLMLIPMTIGSVCAAKKAGLEKAGKHFLAGITGMLPGVIMILMASSIKLIVQEGGILDTILYYVSGTAKNIGGAGSLFLIYGLILVLNFFIASGSAKAFLVMPIIAPLADLVGITRQTSVIAYCFGDGFSNVLYPTNPVLLICLGMTAVSYGKWLKWTWKLQTVVLIVTAALLYAAYVIPLGPF